MDLEFKRGNDPGEVLDGGDPTKPPYSNLKNKVACLFKREQIRVHSDLDHF